MTKTAVKRAQKNDEEIVPIVEDLLTKYRVVSERGIGWFTVTEVIKKTTKNGKAFMRWKCVDSDNRSGWLRVWGNLDDGVEFSTWLADVKNDAGWGMSSSLAKLKKINAFD